jgi:hypothetical protein
MIALPFEMPVTTAVLENIVALVRLLDIQVPITEGETVATAVLPTQIVSLSMDTLGFGLTIILLVVALHCEPNCTNVKLATPIPMAVTNPLGVTVATDGLLDVQEPPEVGDNCLVPFIHMNGGPFSDTTGLLLTVITSVGNETQPELAFV